MIPISKPQLGPAEQQAVAQVLASGMLAQGPRVAEFERAFAKMVGVKHAIATSNGTTALHTALLAHGIGPGDEVITTPFTFMASISAILYTGAAPVLVDIDASFNLDAAQVEAAVTPRTRAVMPVHLYGMPADLDVLSSLARRHNLALIEDACQAHGAEFDGKRAGAWGTGGFSFYATKNMTTGEGGMITTDDDAIAQQARLLINHGMRVRYYHERVGYNYRMTDLAAALGIEQLKRLDEFNVRRRANAALYDRLLDEVDGLILPRVYPRRTHVYHQYTVRITPAFGRTRDEVVDLLKERGVGTGIYYPVPVHKQANVRHLGWENLSLPVAEQMAREVLSLPVHPGVSEQDIQYIAATLASLRKA